MNIDDYIVNLFTPNGFMSVVRFMVMVWEFLYLFFAFIVIRQVNLMKKSFITPAGRVFSLVAYAHFLATVILIILSLLIL